MSDLVLPDPRFEMPELFIPNRIPSSAFEVDFGKSITNGLIATLCANGNVLGGTPLELNEGERVGTAGGLGVTSENSTSSDGGARAIAHRAEIINEFTIFFIGTNLVGLNNNTALFCYEQNVGQYRGAGIAVQHGFWSPTLQVRYWLNESSSQTTNSGSTGVLESGVHSYIITRSAGTVLFYKADSGVNYITGTTTGLSGDFDSAIYPPTIATGNYIDSNFGGSSQGGRYTFIAVWNRVLSLSERISISQTKNQFLIPK